MFFGASAGNSEYEQILLPFLGRKKGDKCEFFSASLHKLPYFSLSDKILYSVN